MSALLFLMPSALLAHSLEGSAPLACPGDQAWNTDEAHIAFEPPQGWDYNAIVNAITEGIQTTQNPESKKIESRRSKNFAYQDRPVLVYRTGKYHHVPQEEVTEFMVIRPYEECSEGLLENGISPSGRYVLTRRFSNDALNIDIVRALQDHNISVGALSPLGLSWIWDAQGQH